MTMEDKRFRAQPARTSRPILVDQDCGSTSVKLSSLIRVYRAVCLVNALHLRGRQGTELEILMPHVANRLGFGASHAHRDLMWLLVQCSSCIVLCISCRMDIYDPTAGLLHHCRMLTCNWLPVKHPSLLVGNITARSSLFKRNNYITTYPS